MARTLNTFCGFETGGLEEVSSPVGTNGNGPTLDSTTKRTGTYSIQCAGLAGIQYVSFNTTDSNDQLFGFAVRFSDVTPAANVEFLHVDDSALTVAHVRLRMKTDGNIAIVDANNVEQATAANPFTAGSWHLVEVRLTKSGTGTCTVWVDGVSFLTTSSKDFLSGASAMSAIVLRGSPTTGEQINFDDFYSYYAVNADTERLSNGGAAPFWEVLGPYQKTDGGAASNGDTLGDGTWALASETPLNEGTSNDAAYTVNPSSGHMITSSGTRYGPSIDARFTYGTGVASKYIQRLKKGSGTGGHNKIYGTNAATTTEAVTLTTSYANFMTLSTTYIPSTSETFAMGMGCTGNSDAITAEMWAMLLQTRSAAVVYDETGKEQVVLATVDLTDLARRLEALEATVLTTVELTAIQDYLTEALEAAILATVELTDRARYVDTLEATVLATVEITEALKYVEALEAAILATVELTEIIHYNLEALEATVLTTVELTEIAHLLEALEVAVLATVELTSLQHYIDAVEQSILATVEITDAIKILEALEAVVLVTTEETNLQRYVEALEAAVLATVEVTDIARYIDALETIIIAPVEQTSIQRYIDTLETAILATVEITDAVLILEALEAVVLITVEETNLQHYIQALETVVLATVEEAEIQHYNLEALEAAVLTTIEETNLQHYNLQALEATILATVEVTDAVKILEATEAVALVTVEETSLQHYIDTLEVAIPVVVELTDVKKYLEAVEVTVVATVEVIDAARYVEAVETTVLAIVIETNIQRYFEAVETAVLAIVIETNIQTYNDEALEQALIVFVEVTELLETEELVELTIFAATDVVDFQTNNLEAVESVALSIIELTEIGRFAEAIEVVLASQEELTDSQYYIETLDVLALFVFELNLLQLIEKIYLTGVSRGSVSLQGKSAVGPIELSGSSRQRIRL